MKPASRWREHSRLVIERVIATHGTDDPEALRKAISAAYPFGQRRYYPYRIWLQEVHAAMTRVTGPYFPPGDQPTIFEARP